MSSMRLLLHLQSQPCSGTLRKDDIADGYDDGVVHHGDDGVKTEHK